MTAKNKQSSGVTFLILGAVCLIAMFSEYLILQCEQIIYQKNYFGFTITESITHWVVIYFVWGIIGTVLLYVSNRVYRFDVTKRDQKPSAWGWAAAVILISVSVISKYYVWNGWKIAIDVRNSGWYQFTFQLVYYLFEAFIVLLTVIFTQEAGERLFKTKKIPWGGAVLAVTWGFSHIATQGSAVIGLSYVVYSLLFGIAYLAVKKNLYIAYPVVVLIFCCNLCFKI